MPRWSGIPSLRVHKPSGQNVVEIDGRAFYLGEAGGDGARQRYNELVAGWLQRGRKLDGREAAAVLSGKAAEAHAVAAAIAHPGGAPLSIAEVCLKFLDHARGYYLGRDGQPNERALGHWRGAIKILRETFGRQPAGEFGPLKLQTVRERFIAEKWCRSYVNDQTRRLRRLFNWAVSQELIPAAVGHGLASVEGLRRGRSAARETNPVRPVPDAYVDAVKAHVADEVAAMIELQRLTGMRSGEVTIMRTCDLDTTGNVWQYRPAFHKTEHHGHERIVWIGPKAQDVLRPWLRTNLTEYLFSPWRARERRFTELRAVRKTRVQPSQQNRRKAKPKKLPRATWSVASYQRAVTCGCDLAFPLPADLAQREKETAAAWRARLGKRWPEVEAHRKTHRWHPHQLRHNAATTIRKEFGLETARAVLGQRTLTAALVYAEQSASVAREAAEKIG